MRTLVGRLIDDERGMNSLERFGLFAAVLAVIVFIPAVRAVFAELFDATLGQVDDEGHLTGNAIAMRGILITIVAMVAFFGSGYLLLYTNLGARLGFLVTGAVNCYLLFVLLHMLGRMCYQCENKLAWE